MARVEFIDPQTPLEKSFFVVNSHTGELVSKYGTPLASGKNEADWRPYHSGEASGLVSNVSTLFYAARRRIKDPSLDFATRALLSQLEPDDLPGMMIAASFFYPDLDHLYDDGSSVAIKKMRQAGILRQRDTEIIPAVVDAAIVKQNPGDPILFKPIAPDSPYAAHKKVFVDALWGGFRSSPNAMAFMALLGVEKLIKNAVDKRESNIPRNIEEVMQAPITEEGTKTLRKHIREQEQIFFGEHNTYVNQLPTSDRYLPFFPENQAFFLENIVSKIKKPTINLAALLSDTRNFSRILRIAHTHRDRRLPV